jgi:hypothetical protein
LGKSRYFDIRVVDVEGHNAISETVLIRCQNAELIEKDNYHEIVIRMGYGLDTNLEKSLKENPNLFAGKSLFLLFTQDNITFQCIMVVHLNISVEQDVFQLNIAVVSPDSGYALRVADYLKQKAQNEAMMELSMQKIEKIVFEHTDERHR